jgi:hypothetical protein
MRSIKPFIVSALILAALIIVAFASPTEAANGEPTLLVSKLGDRSFPRSLEGQTLAGNIYVFVGPEKDISQVEFYINNRAASGVPVIVERLAPFDLAGGPEWANAFDTRGLRDGAHSITARITMAAGGSRIITASFTIRNTGPVDRSIYWGVSLDRVPWDMNRLSAWESLVRKQPSIVHFWQPWSERGIQQPLQPRLLQSVRNHGAIPMITWFPVRPGASRADLANYQLSDIIAGRHDEYLRDWAADARNWGHPFFLRWGHEMNGYWFPWSEDANGNRRGEYAQAWRHMVDIFRSTGAHNVTWVWCPNVDWDGSDWPTMESLYPGDDYVDWTCLDGFNWGEKNGGWRKFNEVFRWSYENILSFAPDKPMLIGELGASEKGGSKAAWIRETLGRDLLLEFPGINAVVWYNHVDDQDWRIESSFASVEAFRAAIAAPYYRSNIYSNLAASSIAPPQ